MKNLMLSLIVAVAFVFSAAAQTSQKKGVVLSKTQIEKKDGKFVAKKKTAVIQPTEKKTVFKKDGKNVVLKKDGTPDKRYKANQVLKKDGTPDKRYKVNKTTTVTKK